MWLSDSLSLDRTVDYAAYTSGSTGATVDRRDAEALANFDAAAILLDVQSWTDGTHDFTIQHAEDDGTDTPDTWEDVPADQLSGSLPTVDASDDEGQHYVEYLGDRPFLRVNTTASGTTTGSNYGVLVLHGAPDTTPVR